MSRTRDEERANSSDDGNSRVGEEHENTMQSFEALCGSGYIESQSDEEGDEVSDFEVIERGW